MNQSELSATIDRWLRLAHPGGIYEEPAREAWDRHFSAPVLERTLEELFDIPGTRSVVAVPEWEVERSYTVYMGLETAPSWEEFNRGLTGPQRSRTLEKLGGAIDYRVIRLSRIGPFWMDFWNRFEARRGRIEAVLIAGPETPTWIAAEPRVRALLSQAGLSEVRRPLLDAPVPWLSTVLADELARRGRTPHPTVQEALFIDLI